MPDPFLEKIIAILSSNRTKQFVDRILNAKQYPRLALPNGDYATHKMAWGELDGKYVAFPTVVYAGGSMVDLGDKAFEAAIRANEYISFDTASEASWFTTNYKRVWEDQ